MALNHFEEGMYSYEIWEKIYEHIKADITIGKELGNGKCTVILGGQPGAGKSVFYQEKEDLINFIGINGDDYRAYHPHINEIIKTDIEHYSERTQSFSNSIVERLIDDLSDKGYNLIIEGTSRNPNTPLKTCIELKQKGYYTELVVVGCDAEISWKSTIKRAQQQKNAGLKPRIVPIDTFNFIVNNVSENLGIIYDQKCFERISIIDRDRNILYDSNTNKNNPSEILRKIVNVEHWNKVYDDYEKQFIKEKIKILQSSLKRGIDR